MAVYSCLTILTIPAVHGNGDLERNFLYVYRHLQSKVVWKLWKEAFSNPAKGKTVVAPSVAARRVLDVSVVLAIYFGFTQV